MYAGRFFLLALKRTERCKMVDLFRDIPEEQIEHILSNIRANLGRVDLYDGHTIKKHVDIQPGVLKTRITMSDIRYATSFYDFKIAKAAVKSLLEQCYEGKIARWLLSSYEDILVLHTDFRRAIGYGYRREDDTLHEGLSKMRLVLQKEEARDWGFRIVTCFPTF